MKILILVFFLLGCSFMSEVYSGNLIAKDYFQLSEDLSLINLIDKSDLEGIRRYKESGGNIDAKGKEGMTPLAWAIYHKKNSVVNALFDLGVDFNYEAEVGRTPLAVAAFNGDRKLVAQLLAKGANPNTEYSFSVNKPLFAELLFGGNEELALYLLEHGADINYQAKHDQQTAIMVFYGIGRWDLVYWLLEHGADPYIKDGFGFDLQMGINKMIEKNRKPDLLQKRWFVKVQDHLNKTKK